MLLFCVAAILSCSSSASRRPFLEPVQLEGGQAGTTSASDAESEAPADPCARFGLLELCPESTPALCVGYVSGSFDCETACPGACVVAFRAQGACVRAEPLACTVPNGTGNVCECEP